MRHRGRAKQVGGYEIRLDTGGVVRHYLAMEQIIDKSKIIRDAATVILLRHDGAVPRVLMGQRGANAAFMPNKYVFPGGAVDPEDYNGPPLNVDPRLAQMSNAPGIGAALTRAALRELWEETGLRLSPNQGGLQFIFRAITPKGRPRRFDARFFMADAALINADLDDFSAASDELSHLHWIDLPKAKALELPFITEVVLAEVQGIVKSPDKPRKVPFFHHSAQRSHFSLL